MPFALIDALLRGMVIALLLVLSASLMRHGISLPRLRAFFALALGLLVQVVGSMPLFEQAVPRAWQVPFVAVSVGNAVLFWILIQALFDDEFAFRPVHALAWLAAAILGALSCARPFEPGGVAAATVTVAQRSVPVLFSVLAAYTAAAQWRADLVEPRRRLRAYILATGVVYTLAELALRLASPGGRLSEAGAALDVTALMLILLGVAARMLRAAPSDLFAPGRTAHVPELRLAVSSDRAARAAGTAPARPDPADDRLAAALERAMAEQRAYRSENLTVARLAARLAVPEYRLRRVINQKLGHRNFNAYVNGLRLDEARASLADANRAEVPVLTIALEAGFQSIGPFNRVFKAATGLTPSEFRRRQLADSSNRPAGTPSFPI